VVAGGGGGGGILFVKRGLGVVESNDERKRANKAEMATHTRTST
jgi:hypothetical protein